MKSIFNQISSVFMAIIVMVSTMSMTVNKHYCSNILVDTALFQEAKTCGMDDDSSHQSDDNHEQDEKDSCCSSENELIKGQDELQLQKVDFNFEQVVFVAAYVHSYFELFTFENSKPQSFRHYKSPPDVKAIFKLDETYLI